MVNYFDSNSLLSRVSFSGFSSIPSLGNSSFSRNSSYFPGYNDTEFLDGLNEYKQVSESYDIAEVGRNAAIASKVSNVISTISRGHEEKALVAYEALLEEMKKQESYAKLVREDGDDTQLRAYARVIIEDQLAAANGGQPVSLEDFIRDNASDMIDLDGVSDKDLLKEICDLDDDDNRLEAGAKGAAICGGVALAAGLATKGGALGTVLGGPIGTVVGAGIGAAVGFVAGGLFGLFSKH